MWRLCRHGALRSLPSSMISNRTAKIRTSTTSAYGRLGSVTQSPRTSHHDLATASAGQVAPATMVSSIGTPVRQGRLAHRQGREALYLLAFLRGHNCLTRACMPDLLTFAQAAGTRPESQDTWDHSGSHTNRVFKG